MGNYHVISDAILARKTIIRNLSRGAIKFNFWVKYNETDLKSLKFIS